MEPALKRARFEGKEEKAEPKSKRAVLSKYLDDHCLPWKIDEFWPYVEKRYPDFKGVEDKTLRHELCQNYYSEAFEKMYEKQPKTAAWLIETQCKNIELDDIENLGEDSLFRVDNFLDVDPRELYHLGIPGEVQYCYTINQLWRRIIEQALEEKKYTWEKLLENGSEDYNRVPIVGDEILKIFEHEKYKLLPLKRDQDPRKTFIELYNLVLDILLPQAKWREGKEESVRAKLLRLAQDFAWPRELHVMLVNLYHLVKLRNDAEQDLETASRALGAKYHALEEEKNEEKKNQVLKEIDEMLLKQRDLEARAQDLTACIRQIAKRLLLARNEKGKIVLEEADCLKKIIPE